MRNTDRGNNNDYLVATRPTRPPSPLQHSWNTTEPWSEERPHCPLSMGRTKKDQDNIGKVVLISINIHVDENGSEMAARAIEL